MANVGRGKKGLKGLKRLPDDIQGLSDEAKRKRRLEKTVADKQRRIKAGNTVRRVSEREKDKFRHKTDVVRRLQRKAANLRASAKEVDRSGTGNKKAAATFRRAADLYLERVKKVRSRKQR